MNEGGMTDLFEEAILLIASVRAALKNGVRHYDWKGNLLVTEKEILECLGREGQVSCDEEHRLPTVSIEEMEREVREEFADRIQ